MKKIKLYLMLLVLMPLCLSGIVSDVRATVEYSPTEEEATGQEVNDTPAVDATPDGDRLQAESAGSQDEDSDGTFAGMTETDAVQADIQAKAAYEPYSLTRELAEQKRALSEKIDEKTLKIMKAAGKKIEKLKIPEKSIQVGEAAPNFRLRKENGQQVQLSDLLEQGPVVLTFYRGGWCAYCMSQLQALQRASSEIQARQASLIAVSPENIDAMRQTAQTLGLEFDLLNDEGNEVSRAYGIAFQMPSKLRDVYLGFGIDLASIHQDEKWELPVPATYVINMSGIVVARFVDTDYTRRMDPTDILSALDSLN